MLRSYRETTNVGAPRTQAVRPEPEDQAMNDRNLILGLIAVALVAALTGGAVIGIASNPEAAAIVAKGTTSMASAGARAIGHVASAGARAVENVTRSGENSGTSCTYGKLAGAGASCVTDGKDVTPALVAQGVLTGEFDSTMSGACEGTCSIKRDGNVASQPGAVISGLTQCPVSGVIFEVKEGNASYTIAGGERVYTCCGSCLSRLEAAPAKYLKS